MGAVRLVFHAELRRRWRSWPAIAVLISVVARFVLAATAGGRRTASAFPRFVAAHGLDAVVYATRPVSKLAKLPGVSSATEVVNSDNGQPACDCSHSVSQANLSVEAVAPKARSPFTLVSGRMPDPSS